MKNSSVILIGESHNDIVVPVMVFANLDEGLNHLKELLPNVKPRKLEKSSIVKEFINCYKYNVEFDEGEEGTDALIDKFFTGYYGSCGEIYTLILLEIPNKTVLFSFSLD
ncbi:hypothetical protein LCGC14_2724230 [marine sediment metagenome]|uniref:Uncharacterized protein n=1 Tax=marine sediment metagenome TaxID=412755 RepID=A0A0F8XZ68_9ZZZZ